MVTNFKRVEEFHKVFNPGAKDTLANTYLVSLCEKLITEEYREVYTEISELWGTKQKIDRVKLTKELVDLLYVVYYMGVCFDINLDKAFNIVHTSNMSKLGNDGKPIVRSDGKILKGPNYKEPDLSKL